MNPLAWILDSMKVHPEPVSIPDVSELTPTELAEIRSRLQTFAQVATELRKLVDQELAGALQGSAMLYGQDVYRPSNGKGTAKVQDEEGFWQNIDMALDASHNPSALLAALFSANSVRLTALPKVAELLGTSPEGFKDTFIAYEPSTSPLSVMPIQKAPKFLQDLDEGEIRPVI